MDMGDLNLFIKMLIEEYKLNPVEALTITQRLMADDKEFERVWKLYKACPKRFGGEDRFKEVLKDLLH